VPTDAAIQARLHFLNVVIICIFLAICLAYSSPATSIFFELQSPTTLTQYVCFLLIAALLTGVVFVEKSVALLHRSRKASTAYAMVSLAIVLYSSIVVVPYAPQPGLWSGFGVLSTAAATIFALMTAVKPNISCSLATRVGRRFLLFRAIPLALVAPRLLLFIQPPDGLINLGDTSYHVIDELLAPAAGAMPYSDYSPQYTGMLGWLLLPLKVFGVGGDSLLAVVIVVCNGLNLAVALLVTAVARVMLPNLKRTLTFCAFVAIWTLPGSDLGASTQIREFAHFARFVPALVALLVTLRTMRSVESENASRNFVVSGVVLGISLLNSPETGGTLVLAVALGLLLEGIAHRIGRPKVMFVFVGFSSLILFYIAIAQIRHLPFNLESFVGIRGQALSGSIYSGGLASLVPSPFLIVLSIPFLMTLCLWQTPISCGTRPTPLGHFPSVVIGTWIVLLATKPMMAPITPGIQSLVIPVFLGGVALLGATQDIFLRKKNSLRMFEALPILVILSLPFGAAFPDTRVNVRDELRRISGAVADNTNWSTASPGRPSDAYARNSVAMSFVGNVDSINTQLASRDYQIGYFGFFGNSVEELLGIDNVLGIPAPESLRFGKSQRDLACIPVINKSPDFIIVVGADLPCKGYRLDKVLSLDSTLVFRRA